MNAQDFIDEAVYLDEGVFEELDKHNDGGLFTIPQKELEEISWRILTR